MSRIAQLVAIAALGTLAAASAGQVTLSSSVADGAGGPLVSGTVYVATGATNVPSGQTLTVQPGAIVKFGPGSYLSVNGTLDVVASSTTPARFTSLLDDSVGGDTNQDGAATMPSAGDWNTVLFNSGSGASSLTGLIVRYAGSSSSNDAVRLNSAHITMTDCVVANSAQGGLGCSGSSSPTVTGCSFVDNADYAVGGVRPDAVPGFANNSASGNGGDYIELTNAPVSTAVSIDASNVLGGALVSPSGFSVPAAGSLTLGAGVVIKIVGGGYYDILGTLDVNATAGNPAVLTTITDDAFGGDTNKDGAATTPTPGAWNTLLMRSTSSASVIQGLVVRYAGSASNGAIDCQSSTPTLVDCKVEFSGNSALDLSVTSFPSVTGCAFENNVGVAVSGVKITAVPGFAACTATGNAGDYLQISAGTVDAPTTLTADNMLGGAHVVTTTLQVNSPLTIQAGVVIKFAGGHYVDVSDTLTAVGATGNRVVFTSFADDAIGGDTNKDGPGTGSPGDWNTLLFRAGAAGSSLDLVTVRYAGSTTNGAIDLSSSAITMTRCNIQFSGHSALDLSYNSIATASDCAFDDNAGTVTSATWNALAALRNNTASGNAAGDFIAMTSGSVTGSVRIDSFNYPGEVLGVATTIQVSAADELTLGPGVQIKMIGGQYIDVNGTFNVAATGTRPAVITSLADDTIGGDTNGDGGASAPAPGDWNRLLLRSTAAGFIRHLTVRYAGSVPPAAIDVIGAGVRLLDVRVDHSAVDGIELSGHVGNLENIVCFDCAGAGIDIDAPGITVVNSTLVACGAGIDRTGGGSGTVFNTIAWNNAGTGLGYNVGEVFNCDADAVFAGMDGNVSTDPVFVDELGGDLRLAAASPCIGAADSVVAAGLVTDHDGNSRLLDDDLDGLPFADMGAYERVLYETLALGVPRMGTAMFFGADTVGGPAAFVISIVGVLDGSTFVLPYGFISVGDIATIAAGPQTALGETFIANLPSNPALEGFTFAVQSFVLVSGNPFVGQLTNRWIGSLHQ